MAEPGVEPLPGKLCAAPRSNTGRTGSGRLARCTVGATSTSREAALESSRPPSSGLLDVGRCGDTLRGAFSGTGALRRGVPAARGFGGVLGCGIGLGCEGAAGAGARCTGTCGSAFSGTGVRWTAACVLGALPRRWTARIGMA